MPGEACVQLGRNRPDLIDSTSVEEQQQCPQHLLDVSGAAGARHAVTTVNCNRLLLGHLGGHGQRGHLRANVFRIRGLERNCRPDARR